MADTTIVNTPSRDMRDSDSVAGWAIALIIVVVAAVIAAVYYVRTHGAAANPGTNIQVTVPSGTGGSGTDSSGGTTGGTGAGGGVSY
jgi:hypothetical protein